VVGLGSHVSLDRPQDSHPRLLLHVGHQAKAAFEQLLEELEQIKQFVLLYPPQGEKGPPRTAYVLSQQTLAQQALVKTLGLAAMAS
jgi:hypothetical protein